VIRVLIADDHQVVRSGLEQLLATADDIELAGMAADGAEAIELAADLAPDIILMDLSMPGTDGIAATRAITTASPTIQVVVLTSFSDKQRILDALDAGAAGYVLKHAEPDELLDRQRSSSASPAKMSDREEEVLRLVAEGLANKAIARRLGIAERTVKAHLTNIFQRIGVTDRTQAALWARDHLE
jgi:DNA-binding NarL/FixJ family response regulator